MFDAQRWSELQSGRDCPLCNIPESDPTQVAVVSSGRIRLQDDHDFRGYCILTHRLHVTELHRLSTAELHAFITDVARLARVIEQVCRPTKLNYEILGNEVPHLHCHVVPRYPHDPLWGRPIWLRAKESRRALPAEEFTALRAALADALRCAE